MRNDEPRQPENVSIEKRAQDMQVTRLRGLPKTVLMTPTFYFSNAARRILKTAARHQGIPLKESHIADALPLLYSSQVGVVGPCLGAPAAVLAAETLAGSGLESLIVVGACGFIPTFDRFCRFGDLFFPDSSRIEEGTSRLYGTEGLCHPVSSAVQARLEGLLKVNKLCFMDNTQFHRGELWTTDAPFLETREKLQEFSALGAEAVDMEFSALLTLSRLRHFDIAAILLISDILTNTWDRGFDSKEFKHNAKKAVDLIFQTFFNPLYEATPMS